MRCVRNWNGTVAAAGAFVPAARIFVCATAGVVGAMFVVGAAWGTTRPMISFCFTTASTTSCRAKWARNSLYGIVRTVSWLIAACQTHSIASMMKNGQIFDRQSGFLSPLEVNFGCGLFHISIERTRGSESHRAGNTCVFSTSAPFWTISVTRFGLRLRI